MTTKAKYGSSQKPVKGHKNGDWSCQNGWLDGWLVGWLAGWVVFWMRNADWHRNGDSPEKYAQQIENGAGDGAMLPGWVLGWDFRLVVGLGGRTTTGPNQSTHFFPLTILRVCFAVMRLACHETIPKYTQPSREKVRNINKLKPKSQQDIYSTRKVPYTASYP